MGTNNMRDLKNTRQRHAEELQTAVERVTVASGRFYTAVTGEGNLALRFSLGASLENLSTSDAVDIVTVLSLVFGL